MRTKRDASTSGDSATATSLLSAGIDTYIDTAADAGTGVIIADDPIADTVVAHYTAFYTVLLHYNNGSYSYTDSCILAYIAHLCPIRDGEIVYQARGLYSFINKAPALFSDICDASSGSPADTCNECIQRRLHNSGSGLATNVQSYKLFPNPNTGTFTLQQRLPDGAPVQVEVWDAMGRVIYNGQATFNGQRQQLQLGDLVPGLYMLQVTDSKGQKYNFKFVVDK